MSISNGSLAVFFVPVSAMLVAGVVFGIGYFAALRRTVKLYGTRHFAAPTALTLGRLLGAALFLGFAVRFGALPLLAAFLGFLLVRALTMRAMRRAA
jgi:phosphotransferase system  glucose/maltose/N-acetylglucosamine-specific IIC component